MADHVITGVNAAGDPYIPPLINAEYDNSSWITWTTPISQETVAPSTDFVVKFARSIDLTDMNNSNFQLLRVTQDSPLETTEVANAFETIDLVTDYNSISRELVLHLSNPISALEEYLFVVTELLDSSGNSQAEDHVILFTTSGTGTEYDVNTEFDVDQITVQDYTLVSPPLFGPQGTTSGQSITCSIPNGSRGVIATTITLSGYTALVTLTSITVNEENLDTGAVTVLTPTVTQHGTSFIVTIVLGAAPSASCLYTIDAIYATFQFFGSLAPFYVPLSDLVIFTNAPGADAVLWTRMVYLMSKEVRAMIGTEYVTYELDYVDAIRNYTKYRLLAMFCGQNTNDSFMLGELQVTTGVSSDIDYKAMMDLWESKLFGYSNVVRSVDPMAPRAQGYHHDTGYTKEYYERVHGLFDKRLF
jgi:hypothetical protein